MNAGGPSKENKNPSRAAALVQATGRPCVILVEPRALLRDCVATCLRVANPGSDVLEYSSVRAVNTAQSADITALVLSFLSANEGIPYVAAEVSRAQDGLPKVPIVVVADYQELNLVQEVIRLGVRGYVPRASIAPCLRKQSSSSQRGGRLFRRACCYEVRVTICR